MCILPIPLDTNLKQNSLTVSPLSGVPSLSTRTDTQGHLLPIVTMVAPTVKAIIY